MSKRLRSGTKRFHPGETEFWSTRPISEQEIIEHYNNGQSIIAPETRHPCTRFSLTTRIELGETILVCDACDVIECVSDAYSNDRVEVPPFYGYLCTHCNQRSGHSVVPSPDILYAHGVCKFGRTISLYLIVCDGCRDYTEAMTMGAFRPFRKREKLCRST